MSDVERHIFDSEPVKPPADRPAAVQPQPQPTAADYRAAVDELTAALNQRTALIRLLVGKASPVLHSLEALVYNAEPDDQFLKEADRECKELRDMLAVAGLVK